MTPGPLHRGKDASKRVDKFKDQEWTPILAIVVYMGCSAGTSCFQKLAINAFHRPLLLLAVQTAFGLAVLSFSSKAIALGSVKDAMLFLPVSICFTGKVVFSMIAYDYCTLGTYVVISATCPLFSLPIEAFCFDNYRIKVTPGTVLSILTIMCGVAMYGLTQSKLGGQVVGIVALILKTAVSVVYQTRQRYLMKEYPVGINDLGMMVYNCVVCLVGVVIIALPFGEYKGFCAMCQLLRKQQWMYVAMSCVLTFAIGYFSLKCQRVVSATSFHIIGSICKAAVILFGSLVLKERYNNYSAFACVLVLVGGFFYSQTTSSDKKKDKDENGVSSEFQNGKHLQQHSDCEQGKENLTKPLLPKV